MQNVTLVYKILMQWLANFKNIVHFFQDNESTEKPKGRRGSAGRPKVSQIMKAVQEGEALLKVHIYTCIL